MNAKKDASRAEQAGPFGELSAMYAQREHGAEQAGGDAKCERCNGYGMIGWHTGQTPESFEQHEAPCPDCNKPEDGEAQQLERPLNFYSNPDTAQAFELGIDAERARVKAQHPQRPEGGEWSHITNEWADVATSGLQWLRNIADGISTVGDALVNMHEAVKRCMELKAAPAPPAVGEDVAAALHAMEERWLASVAGKDSSRAIPTFDPIASRAGVPGENDYDNEAHGVRHCAAELGRFAASIANTVPPIREVGAYPAKRDAAAEWPNDQSIQKWVEGYNQACDEWECALRLSATPTQPPVQDARDGVAALVALWRKQSKEFAGNGQFDSGYGWGHGKCADELEAAIKADSQRAEVDRFRHKAGQYDSIVKEVKPADGGQFRNDTIESIRILKERAERAEALAAELEKDARRWRFIMDRFQGSSFVEGNTCWELRFNWDYAVPDSRGYGALNQCVDAAIDARAAGSGEG